MNFLREVWAALDERLFFMPPFPEHLDPLVLLALLLVGGLLLGEAFSRTVGLSRIVGYVAAGALAGPGVMNWLDRDTLALARPVADAALGLLLMETGRNLDLGWLKANRGLLLTAVVESSLAFAGVFAFSLLVVEMSPAWSAVTAAITMTSAPAVVLLTAEESRAQGQVTQRTQLLTAISCAVSFVIFPLLLGLVHTEQSGDWFNAVVHPLWVLGGGIGIGMLCARLALLLASGQDKRSAGQVFVLVAMAMLGIGVAHMLAVPVFLSLFMMGVFLGALDKERVLTYTSLPQGHWILAIVLFVVTGAMLPLDEMSEVLLLQAVGLILVRGVAKFVGVVATGRRDLPLARRSLVGLGIQPLSATAIFMAVELALIYPEVSTQAMLLPLLAAALMEFVGPQLCRQAFVAAGEAELPPAEKKP